MKLRKDQKKLNATKSILWMLTNHCIRNTKKQINRVKNCANWFVYAKYNNIPEILLDCDQSNVGLLLARIIFFCILLTAFSFLSTCIRDPVSI